MPPLCRGSVYFSNCCSSAGMKLQRKTSDATYVLLCVGQLEGFQVSFCLVQQAEFPLQFGVYFVAILEYISKFPFIQKDASGLFYGVSQGKVNCLDNRENTFENMHLSKKCQCKHTKGNLALPVDAAVRQLLCGISGVSVIVQDSPILYDCSLKLVLVTVQQLVPL